MRLKRSTCQCCRSSPFLVHALTGTKNYENCKQATPTSGFCMRRKHVSSMRYSPCWEAYISVHACSARARNCGAEAAGIGAHQTQASKSKPSIGSKYASCRRYSRLLSALPTDRAAPVRSGQLPSSRPAPLAPESGGLVSWLAHWFSSCLLTSSGGCRVRGGSARGGTASAG